MMSRISGNQIYRNNNNNNNSSSSSEQANASVSGVCTTATDLASATVTAAPTAAAAATFNRQRKRRKKKKDKLMLTNQRAVNCSCVERIEGSCNSVSSCSNRVPTACVHCHFNDLTYRENYSTRHHGDPIDFNAKSEYKIDFWSAPSPPPPPPPPPPLPSSQRNSVNNNHNGHIVKCAFAAQTLTQNNYFMRHQRNNVGINRHTEQLQRFAIYENLCEFCGFAIGNGAYHLHCVAAAADKQNTIICNEYLDKIKSENIYENICDLCHSIFDGEQCMSETCKANTTKITNADANSPHNYGEVINVLVKKPPIANNNRQFGKQFSDFLGSFKQKLTSKSGESERKRPKIEIIHNTDTVFKTNKTFDLNEIVQLKDQSASGSGLSVADVIGRTCVDAGVREGNELKVDSSNDLVTEVPLKPIRLCRTSTSDSNFLEKCHRSAAPYLQYPFSESIVSDTILYSNSYAPPSYEDAIQYTSVAPFKLRGRNKPATYDSTSASSFFTYNSSAPTLQTHTLDYSRKSPLVSSLLCDCDESVKQWLTSIERQIHEYSDDNSQFQCGSNICGGMKCIPSKMLNESASKLKQTIDPVSNEMNEIAAANQINSSHTNLRHRIELFKETLLEHRMYSKRNAIYIKDSIGDVTFDAATMPPDMIAPDIDAATTVDSTSLVPVCHQNIDDDNVESSVEIVYLRQKSQPTTHGTAIVENASANALNYGQPITCVDAFEATSQYLQMLKAFYMAQVTLSTSLNRLVLVCGDRQLYFFVKYLVSRSHCPSLERAGALVQPTRYTNIQQIIQLIHKMGVKKQLGDNDKSAQIKSNVVRFNNGTSGKSDSVMVNGFLMRSTNSPSRIPLRSRHKRTIDDYARRKQRTAPNQPKQKGKTLDDVSKASTKESDINLAKSLDDFARKNPDYSSSTVRADIVADANMCNEVQKKINGRENTVKDDESIYQSIWMCKTIGSANDIAAHENDLLNNFDTSENEIDDDTTSHDGHEWEVAQEEFLFSTSHIDAARNTNNRQHMNHAMVDKRAQLSEVKAKNQQYENNNDKLQYQTICVLYNPNEPKWNEIIYDYNNNNGNTKRFRAHNDGHTKIMNTVACKRLIEKNGSPSDKKTHEVNSGQEVAWTVNLDSVNAWKTMLRTVDYVDDEEDVILTESYLLNQKCAVYNNQNNENLQSAHSNESVSDTTKSSESEKTEETDLSSGLSINLSAAPSISPPLTPPPPSLQPPSLAPIESKPKKESGFLNKLQYRRFDVGRNNTKKDDVVQGLFYKNLNGKTHLEPSPPMEIKRLNQSGTGSIVFGAVLDEVEKDEQLADIPRFVVECIRVIEIEENLHTNGIYRASGKKDSIDKLRKRMNESKLRKGTKYVSLKDEDVHTITGALKQFFRELKSELIPEDIVKNLPNDLENEASIVSIRNGLSTIDYLSRETLKYLLQHLIRVDANREHNLMTASNLSIVWGAALFTSSVSITNAFETSDLLRRNTLIKVLIQRYDDIFIDTDRLI